MADETLNLGDVLHREASLDLTTGSEVAPARDDDGRRIYWALAYDATSTDMHGTRMTPDAFRGSAESLEFPILTFHNKASFPVGKPVDVRYDQRGLHVGFIFAGTPEARTAEELVEGGFLRGVSVGFVPRDGFIDKADGATVFSRAELVELSLTPTPSSRKALIDLTRSIGEDADSVAVAFGLELEECDVEEPGDEGCEPADDRATAIETLRSLGVAEVILSLLAATEVEEPVEVVEEAGKPKQPATLDSVRDRVHRNLARTRRHS